jgi:hypothetical protein|tara:strand:- start:17 stop:706 length:690 start_codon:yes stop_codon:yes gene_type:complete
MKKYCLNHTQELREHTEKEIRSLGWDNFEGVVYPEPLDDQNKSELILGVLDKWLKESHDDMVMITFDDLFYGFYRHSGFNLDLIVSKTPEDWDNILLGFENLHGTIPFFMHKTMESHLSGPTILKRSYADRLVNIVGDSPQVCDNLWKDNFSYHYFLNKCGKSYAYPLLPRHYKLVSDSRVDLERQTRMYSIFWTKYYGKEYPKENFFKLESEPCLNTDRLLYRNRKLI